MQQNQDKVNMDTARTLGNIEGKLDGVLTSVQRIDKHLGTQNGRISKTEKKTAYLEAKAFGVGAGGGSIIVGIIELIRNSVG